LSKFVRDANGNFVFEKCYTKLKFKTLGYELLFVNNSNRSNGMFDTITEARNAPADSFEELMNIVKY
jgi:hypothetical protein